MPQQISYRFRDFPRYVKQAESQFSAFKREAALQKRKHARGKAGKGTQGKLTSEEMREIRAIKAASTAALLHTEQNEPQFQKTRHWLYMHLYDLGKGIRDEVTPPAHFSPRQRENILRIAEIFHYINHDPPQFASTDPASGRKIKANFWHKLLVEVEDRYGELAAYQHLLDQAEKRRRLSKSDDLSLRAAAVGATVANRLVKTNAREFEPIMRYVQNRLAGRREYAEMLLRKKVGRKTLTTLLKQRVAGKTGKAAESLNQLHEFTDFLRDCLNLTLRH